MSIVLNLQKNIINNKKSITDLLRESLLIASKLKLNDFKILINNELKGYHDETSILPKYRRLSGTLKFFNPYNGWIPAQYHTEELEKLNNNIPISQSISELENLIANTNNSNKTIIYPLPNILKKDLMTLFNTNLEPSILFNTTQIVGIIEQVKNTLLEWTIKLEENKILGDENMSFSDEEKDKAQKNIHIENFNGVMGNVDSLGNLSTGDYNQNTSTINNMLDTKIDELIKKIEVLNISDKDTVISEIEENRNNKIQLTQILGQLITRGSEIATIAPAIGELLGMLG